MIGSFGDRLSSPGVARVHTFSKLEFLHAVILTQDAYAVGKSLQQLNLEQWRVNVKGLRRDNHELAEPDENMALLVGDVILIAAKPRKVERAERFLLEGN